MTERRAVRVSASFFEDLDRHLSHERGPNGEPSTIDFQAVELIEIIDVFATGFDDLLPLIHGRDDYRLLVKAGVLVRAISVTGQRLVAFAVADRFCSPRRTPIHIELNELDRTVRCELTDHSEPVHERSPCDQNTIIFPPFQAWLGGDAVAALA